MESWQGKERKGEVGWDARNQSDEVKGFQETAPEAGSPHIQTPVRLIPVKDFAPREITAVEKFSV